MQAGRYTNGAANRLRADGDMDVSATGTLTNAGTLAAVGAMHASGNNVVNRAGADINSAATTVTATDTLTNAGRIEGDSVTTNSTTLVNTGTVIGNDVLVNATDVRNTGAQAVIAGATKTRLYASNSITNSDGATIYSGGDLELAKDGTRDAAGLLANQTNTITNDSANIEADGNLDVAAHTLINKRTSLLTEPGTPQSTSVSLDIYTAGIPIGTDSTRSTNKSSSASVGVSFGTGGFGVSAAMSRAHGDANSDAAMQNNTHINASNTATIVSGGDTNVIGANVNANKVVADVGGNLNLASVQDTTHSAAHQSSTGGGFSISQGGGSASFSAQSGHASGNYAGVKEQAGIQAGSGGYDINVKGNTDLKGAYIASTATPDKNQLTTGTLSFSDIQNHSEYDASSVGVSAGGGIGDGGNSYATHGPTSTNGKNTGGALPLYVSESGSSSAATKSAISDGSITITDKESQKQDLATLNRDTSNLNGKVDKTPDLQQVLSNQGDLMNAATAASEAIAKQIGNYADRKEKAARDAAAATDDPALKAQYLQDAKNWAEGGDNRVALHIAGGALTGGLTAGGLGAVGGAAGAGVSAKLAPELTEIAQSIKDAGPTGNKNVDELLGNVASNLLAGGAGALVGGGTGALTGAAVDRFNRQLHEDNKAKEQTLAKKLASESDGKYTVQQIQDQMAQMDLVMSDGGVLPGNVRVASGEMPQDGTEWTRYGVNKAGQTVWTQSLGPGDPDLQAYIVKGAQGSGFSYQATTTGKNPGLVRAPDFVNFQIDYFVGSVWGTFTRDGNAFFGTGVNMALPNPVQASASITAGWLNRTSVAPGQTNNFAGGYAGGMTGAYGIFGTGIMNSPGNGTATIIGVGGGVSAGKNTNVGGVGGGYSNDQGKTGIRW
ncbi:hemagglutinin repeat-containing protein [Burkholderia multivorans]|uniref:hemagglutinin repeat-containing protein n=1 Tax=Burkholderia multivorans TaxID=87883 RepID=UPI003BF7B72D